MHTANLTQLAEGFSFPGRRIYRRDPHWLQRVIDYWLFQSKNPSINLQSLLKVIDSAGIEVNSDNVAPL